MVPMRAPLSEYYLYKSGMKCLGKEMLAEPDRGFSASPTTAMKVDGVGERLAVAEVPRPIDGD